MTVIVLPVVLMFPCLAAAYHCALAVSSAAGNMPVIAFPFVPVFSILVAASHSTLPVGDAAPTIIFVVVSVLTCLMTARHSTGSICFLHRTMMTVSVMSVRLCCHCRWQDHKNGSKDQNCFFHFLSHLLFLENYIILSIVTWIYRRFN